MRLLPEIAIDLYEAQIENHHELRLGPDQIRALFGMARAYLGTEEGKIAARQIELRLAPKAQPVPVKRIVLAA